MALIAAALLEHIECGAAENPKVVALEHCAPDLWEPCIQAIAAWSAVLRLNTPGRIRLRVELADTDDAYEYAADDAVLVVTPQHAAMERIMRGIALGLGFGESPPPFDWIDREFPGAGVHIEGENHYSQQLTARIMSRPIIPGARLSASTVEAVHRAQQNSESLACIDDADCAPGFQCRQSGESAILPNQCIRRGSKSLTVMTIALIAVWAGAAALVVAL